MTNEPTNSVVVDFPNIHRRSRFEEGGAPMLARIFGLRDTEDLPEINTRLITISYRNKLYKHKSLNLAKVR